jgi:2'-5' RNA ligase
MVNYKYRQKSRYKKNSKHNCRKKSQKRNINKTSRKDSHYFLEIRSSGYAKKYVDKISMELKSKFNSQHSTKPHITLFGPFTIPGNQQEVVSKMIQVCKKYQNPNLIYYNLKGFNSFRKDVIYLDVKPSEDLKNIRYELAQKLLPITKSKSLHDKEGKNTFNFHMTLAFKNIGDKFNKIWTYLQKKEVPNINQHLLRVAILKNHKILYEYDLILKKALDRKNSLRREVFADTINVFNKLKRKNYGQKSIKVELNKQKTFLERIKSFF